MEHPLRTTSYPAPDSMPFGVLVLHKPQGMTSHDVISRLRKIFGVKRIGHLGTLDPMATGVLPVCVGRATRLIEYFADNKRYSATITLGQASSTQDAEGIPLPAEPGLTRNAADISLAHIQDLLPRFTGEFQQRVPLHSAVHVGGKKLYRHAHAYAKSGQPIPPQILQNLPVRTVSISRISVLAGPQPSVSLLQGSDGADEAPPLDKSSWRDLVLDVSCGSGTYIRALARDLGEALGCPAHLSALIRTEHGGFKLAEAISLETLAEVEDPTVFLQVPNLPLLRVIVQEPEQLLRFTQGMPLKLQDWVGPVPKLKGNAIVQIWYANQLVAIAKNDEGVLRPQKVLYPPSNPGSSNPV